MCGEIKWRCSWGWMVKRDAKCMQDLIKKEKEKVWWVCKMNTGTDLIEFPSAWRTSGLEPNFINFISLFALSQNKTKANVIQRNTVQNEVGIWSQVCIAGKVKKKERKEVDRVALPHPQVWLDPFVPTLYSFYPLYPCTFHSCPLVFLPWRTMMMLSVSSHVLFSILWWRNNTILSSSFSSLFLTPASFNNQTKYHHASQTLHNKAKTV